MEQAGGGGIAASRKQGVEKSLAAESDFSFQRAESENVRRGRPLLEPGRDDKPGVVMS